jgi:PAS domain S-box-containing protein
MNTETENANDAPRPAANPDRPRREFDEDGSRRELLELLFTHVANAIFLTESDGRIIDVNPAACAMLGFAREELLGMWPWDFVTSASRDEILALIGSTKPGVPVSVQRLYRRKSGESRTMDLRLTRFGCADRELIAASCRDLTEQVDLELRLRDLDERRRIEEELRRLNAELSQQAAHLREVNQTLFDSEQRLRLAIETGRIGLWVWNSTDVTNSGDWSERLKEIFGLPLDAEVTHEMFLKCVHPEDRERVDHAVMQALAGTPGGEYRAEYRTIHPRDGTEHWVTARGQAFFNSDGQAIRFIGTVMDITERKLAEEASVRLTQKLEERVRERTASLLRIQRLSQTGSSSWNVSTGEIVWSEETYRIFGFDPGVKITPEMVASRIHPDDLPKFRQMLASEGEDFQFDHRILMPDGVTKHLQVAATAVRDNSGELQEWIGAVRNVTEIRRSEDYLRLAIDTIPGLVWSSLPDGHIEYLNKRWLDYTGLTLEQASGWGWQVAIHPEDLPGLLDYWKSILAAGERGEYEARLRRFDGEYRWFLFRGVPLYDKHGSVVKWYGTNTDVEALRASEHVARGQLEALTQMLGALSQEGDPERLLEHVARMIHNQMNTHSVTFWAKNDADVLDRLVTFENNHLHFPTESATAAQIKALRALGHPVWDEFFRTGTDCVEGEFDCDPPRVRLANRENAAWHPACGNDPVDPTIYAVVKKIAEMGIATTLTVPMMISGRFEGIIITRFTQKRKFRPEELELVKALAYQAMLIVQMMRLSRQSRQTAVVSERNRLARDIHDTLAQGFTGVIMQLQAAKGATARGGLTDAATHIERAEDLARSSLGEARRSVRALRPLSLFVAERYAWRWTTCSHACPVART